MGEVLERLFSRMGAKAFAEYGVIGIVSVVLAYFVLLFVARYLGYAFKRRAELWVWFRSLGSARRNGHRRLESGTLLLAACSIVLLVAAFSDWPYFMYVLLRVFICFSSAYIATKLYSQRRFPLTWVGCAVAVLYNPVLPVRMARSDWEVINYMTSAFFLGLSAYLNLSVLLRFGQKVRPKEMQRQSAMLARTAALACEQMKGKDTRILELKPDDSGLADFFVVTSAATSAQASRIASRIQKLLRQDFQVDLSSDEGQSSEWILLDYVDCVVHIFIGESRAFYGIDTNRKTAASFTLAQFESTLSSD